MYLGRGSLYVFLKKMLLFLYRITRKELGLHCRRTTRGATVTLESINRLVDIFTGEVGKDTTGRFLQKLSLLNQNVKCVLPKCVFSSKSCARNSNNSNFSCGKWCLKKKEAHSFLEMPSLSIFLSLILEVNRLMQYSRIPI